jgi:hypothetical protein
MQINGKNFKVYLSDTVDTIKDRIAISMDTLPQYLVFDPELESPAQTGNLVVVNALAPILNSKEFKFPEDRINFDKISREEAERLFVVTHDITSTDKTETDIEMFLTYVIKGLTVLNAKTIWKDRRDIRKKMKDKIDKLRKEVDTTTRSFEEFENIPSIKTVEYEVSMVQFNIRFGVPRQGSITVPELFNSLTVTKMAPYASTGSSTPFYKIFHDFAPNPDWLELETPNVILVKVNGEVTTNLRRLKNQYKKYTDAAFTIIINDAGQSEIIATLSMSVGYRNVSRDVFIDRALQIFPGLDRSMITRIDELSTGGFITYPDQTILIPIWAELCMNNPFFNKIVALNESIRASKIKLNAYTYILNTSDILSISMKETDKANMYGMEDEGSNFIRVRVKAKTIADSLKYQKILGRLFTLYNNERDLILAEYRNYLGPKFLKDDQTKLIRRPRKLEKLDLRAIAPDIFLPTYSRKCPKRPTIITREQAAQYRRTKEKQVIEFPAHGESIKRYYVCDHATHPYPGLRDNTFENKTKFPYIPCCYTKDQNREGTKFRHYYDQDTLKIKNSAEQDIFISGKTLRPGLPGTLPPNIKELFSLIEPNPEFQFIRVGSNVTKSSFLECVMLALNVQNIQFLQVEDRIPVVERMRREITTETNAMAAKQEFYDEPIASIVDKMATSNLNALEFGHVLELVFNCNIFVLSASDKDPSGTIHVPRHAQAYYKMKPTRSTVFIYQLDINTNDMDISEIHCELITRTKTPDIKVLDNMDTSFPYYDHVVQKMWEVFRNLNRSFSHNSMLPAISIPRLNVKSQVIDIYGKCRVMNIDFNGNMITMVSEPLPPYNADNATQVHRTSLGVLKAFGKANRVVFVKQCVKAGRVREVEATMSKGNLNVTFLCDDASRLEGVITMDDPEEYGQLIKPTNTVVSHFNHNKKIAKIIYQYGLYFMSRFMHAKGYTTKPMNERRLLRFIKQHTVIKPNHIFTSRNLSSKYSLDSQFVDGQSKVITTSREMLVRLMYMLRLYQNTHFDELIVYKDKVHIGGFYDEISDFDESPSQFLLDSPGAVTGLIESYKTSNTVTKNVKINHSQPYFMYNPVIADQIYLAQNVMPVYREEVRDESEEGERRTIIKSGLQVATGLVRFWNRYGYNAYAAIGPSGPYGEDVEEVDGDKPVDVYSYVNTEEVTNLTGHVGAVPGMVLGYLVNGEALYTALMSL